MWNLIIKKEKVENCPNNPNYITTEFTKTFCNYFLKSKVKNSQRWYLLGRTSRRFCDVDLYFVVILHLSMFFIHIFFSTSSLTFLWTIARFLDPFCTFSPAYRRVIRNTFIFQPFCYLLTASATVLSGHFLPTGAFSPCTPSWHFGTTCFYQGFTGSRQLLSWKLQGFILILETQTRTICLFDSQQSTIF